MLDWIVVEILLCVILKLLLFMRFMIVWCGLVILVFRFVVNEKLMSLKFIGVMRVGGWWYGSMLCVCRLRVLVLRVMMMFFGSIVCKVF